MSKDLTPLLRIKQTNTWLKREEIDMKIWGLQVQKVGLVIETQGRWHAWSQGGGYGMIKRGGGVYEHGHGHKCI